MKYLLAVLFSAVLSTSAVLGFIHITPPAKQQVQTSEFANIRASVKVWRGEMGQCSGVMISDGWMLTAAHCFQDQMQVDGKDVILVKKDENRDLMLLRVVSGCPCVNVAFSSPLPDTKVFIVGYPMYKNFGVQYLTEGRYQGILHSDEESLFTDGNFAATSVPGFFGNSGGGAFVKNEKGEYVLVGIVSFMLAAPTMTGISTPESIDVFLKG